VQHQVQVVQVVLQVLVETQVLLEQAHYQIQVVQAVQAELRVQQV
jgi:hypothetical protein